MILLQKLLFTLVVSLISAQTESNNTEATAPPDTTTYSTTLPDVTIGEARRDIFPFCGIKGPTYNRGNREVLDSNSEQIYTKEGELQHNKEEEETPTVPEGESRNITESTNSTAEEPAVGSSDWEVPSLKETVFTQYVGEPSPFDTRITYGELSGRNEFPWQVAMAINRKFQCGASLISNNHVLTAAHCVNRYVTSPSQIELSIGDWDLRTTNDGHSLKVTVEQITVHPTYNQYTLQNDVAVLKLSKRVEFTDRIRPICLPNSDLNLVGEEAIVSGWGRNEARKLQPQLHHLRANIISNTLCNQRWSANGAPKAFIVNTMLCMDATNGDSCSADSGGPTIYENPAGSGKYLQVGIVAFGSGSCTDANLPGVYMRVSQYTDWIRQQMI